MKPLLLAGCLAFTLTHPLLSAPPLALADLIAQGDLYDQKLQTQASLAAYLEAEKLSPPNADLYRKIAREFALAMPDTPSNAAKLALGQKALAYAQRAVTTDPQNATAHLALAICYGRLASLVDNKTKLSYSKLLKSHAEKSIALNPSDDYAYHVLGAWHYEMASLNPILLGLAKIIYGNLPPASYDDATRNFQKAIQLNPQRVAHHVELGRTYAALNQTALAKAELKKGLALPNTEKDDPGSKERANLTLRQLPP